MKNHLVPNIGAMMYAKVPSGERVANGYLAEKGYQMIRYSPYEGISSSSATALFRAIGAMAIWSCWHIYIPSTPLFEVAGV